MSRFTFNAPRLWGTSKEWVVLNEDTGKVGGIQTEHWDDSLDANVFLAPVRQRMFPHEIGPEKESERLEWALEELKKMGIVPPKELWQ